jgi:uncharacterized damage-inducible protein DinB
MEQQQIFADMAMKAWNIQLSRADKFFSSVSDEAMSKEVAPGKNSIIYLLGHLIAANDSMLSLFGKQRLYAHFDEPFLKSPDKSGQQFPSVQDLRNDWKQANEALTAMFTGMSPSDWMSKHTAMTDEDFTKEPGRNKLSVLINRTNHMAYHLGQLVLTN